MALHFKLGHYRSLGSRAPFVRKTRVRRLFEQRLQILNHGVFFERARAITEKELLA
jgi:hypothetical protein